MMGQQGGAPGGRGAGGGATVEWRWRGSERACLCGGGGGRGGGAEPGTIDVAEVVALDHARSAWPKWSGFEKSGVGAAEANLVAEKCQGESRQGGKTRRRLRRQHKPHAMPTLARPARLPSGGSQPGIALQPAGNAATKAAQAPRLALPRNPRVCCSFMCPRLSAGLRPGPLRGLPVASFAATGWPPYPRCTRGAKNLAPQINSPSWPASQGRRAVPPPREPAERNPARRSAPLHSGLAREPAIRGGTPQGLRPGPVRAFRFAPPLNPGNPPPRRRDERPQSGTPQSREPLGPLSPDPAAKRGLCDRLRTPPPLRGRLRLLRRRWPGRKAAPPTSLLPPGTPAKPGNPDDIREATRCAKPPRVVAPCGGCFCRRGVVDGVGGFAKRNTSRRFALHSIRAPP